MNRKLFILLLVLTLILTSVVNADGTTINDIGKSSSYARSAILSLAQQNIISGDEKGNFNPQKSVTRAEMVALMAKGMKLELLDVPETATFIDVPTNNWAAKYGEAAYKEGIITGISETEFRPNEIITREQMAVMFARALKLLDKDIQIEMNNINAFSDKQEISNWAQREVELALEAELMNGVSFERFEPKTVANKEQSAVVIQRMIRNKAEIIEAFKGSTVGDEAPKLVINNDPVELKNNIVVQDGVMYLPMEFINKTSLNKHGVDMDDSSLIFGFDPSEDYSDSGIYTIWMQVGNKMAYKNLGGDPLTVKEVPVESHLPLEFAPIQVNGKTYFSAKDLFRIFSINYRYDDTTKTAIVNDSKIRVSPNLYYALKHLVNYSFVGELKSQSTLKTNNGTKENTVTEISIDKQSNDYTITSYRKKTYEEKGQLPTSFEQQLIIIENRYYRKDFTDGKWKLLSTKPDKITLHVDYNDPIFTDFTVKSSSMNIRFFEHIKDIEAKYEGIVYVSGIKAKKYVMIFDADTIKQTMSDYEYSIVKPLVNKALNGKLDYKYEFYVANDRIIKQTFEFRGDYLDPETKTVFDYHAKSTLLYKNIGKMPYIVPPAASEIK